MTEQSFDIIALGEILIDFVPNGQDIDNDSNFIRKAGGAPLNLLATASNFGCNCAFIGSVGNDIHGKYLIGKVKECNVCDKYIKIDSLHNTTLAFVELNSFGDRDFSFYRTFGADRFISKDDIPIDVIKNSKIFHFGSLSLTDNPSREATEYAVKLAKENGCIITYDPNYRQPLWKNPEQAFKYMSYLLPCVDILKCSVEELYMLSGIAELKKSVYKIFDIGVKIILVTDGGNGSFVCYNNEILHLEASDVNVIDTTGAGDIYFGSFISELIKAEKKLNELSFNDVVSFAEFATEVAGLSTEKHGAIASIPKEI